MSLPDVAALRQGDSVTFLNVFEAFRAQRRVEPVVRQEWESEPPWCNGEKWENQLEHWVLRKLHNPLVPS